MPLLELRVRGSHALIVSSIPAEKIRDPSWFDATANIGSAASAGRETLGIEVNGVFAAAMV